MSASQSIQGLIKWTQREEWRDDFEATLERHVGSACRSAGIGFDELAEIIGNHWMTTLWGCALEDIISARRGERNVAEDYLKRRGWKESAGTRDHIRALRRSTMSLYEVSDIVVGESFLARDLARAGEPVRVFERSATRSLSQWDRIAARVVTVLGKTQITGTVLPFSHQLAEEALASIERVRKKARAEAMKIASSLGRNVEDSDFALVTGVDEVLAESAFMFSNLWLDDMLHRALNPSLPQMQNTDGEPLEFITVHFLLVSQSNLPAVRAALDDLRPLRKESDTFWNWVEEKTRRRKSANRKTADTQSFSTTIDGAVVLGAIELTAKAITLSVNSEARSARGRALLEPVLATLVRAPLVERQTVEQMMARDRLPSAPKPRLSRVPLLATMAAGHVVLSTVGDSVNARFSRKRKNRVMTRKLHSCAYTNVQLRREIQQSGESERAVAARLGLNPKTVAKWRNRTTTEDARMGPKRPVSTVLSAAEEALIVVFRKHTRLPLEVCLAHLKPTIPALSRSMLHRCLKRYGVSRIPRGLAEKAPEFDLGAHSAHFTIEVCAMPGDAGGHLFVAINQTRFVFAKVMKGVSADDAADFLDELRKNAPGGGRGARAATVLGG